MIEVFEHASLPYDIPHTLRSYHWSPVSIDDRPFILPAGVLTFIFPDVFEGKGQSGIFPLDNPDFPKGPLPHHSEKSEMIEVHYTDSRVSLDHVWELGDLLFPRISGRPPPRLAVGLVCRSGRKVDDAPSSVKTTGFPLAFPMGRR